MATLTTQEVLRTGLQATYATATAGGDSFTPGDDVFLHVVNGGGGNITVTVDTPREAIPEVALDNPVATVDAGQDEFLGPYPYAFFAQADDGLADITWSGVTSVTVAVLQLKQP